MPKFNFDAKGPDGKLVRGTVVAGSQQEARVRLKAQGFDPTKIVEPGNFLKGLNKGGSDATKVKSKDLQIFTRQLSTLINSGVHLVQGLELLAKGTSSPGLKSCLTTMVEEVGKGKGLAVTMAKFPKVFDRLYVNMVKAGEEGGVLDTVLDRLAVYIEKAVKLKGRITGALWYPAGICFVAALVIIAIMTFVIPQFKELFEGSGKELPGLTVMVIGMSEFFMSYWYIIFFVLGAVVFIGMNWYASTSGRAQFDKLVLKVPLFGNLVKMGAIARFTRTLSTLLSSGVSILEALEICANVVGNKVMEDLLRESKDSIMKGKTITAPFAKTDLMPDLVVQMMTVGEQTGALDQMLNKIADFYEEEVDTVVGSVTSIIEPILMVFLGGIISVLVIAMYLPIFNLASAVG